MKFLPIALLAAAAFVMTPLVAPAAAAESVTCPIFIPESPVRWCIEAGPECYGAAVAVGGLTKPFGIHREVCFMCTCDPGPVFY